MRHARRVRTTAAIGALTAGLLASFAAPAAATTTATITATTAATGGSPAGSAILAPGHPWRGGYFEVTGAPILPEDSPPDGWLCHLLISCRPGVLATAGLTADDPRPIATTRVGAPLQVDCGFGLGNWFKIHFTRPGSATGSVGWVAADAVDIVSSGRSPDQCAAFVDW